MATKEDANRFSLPVETFIRTFLQEKFPKLNLAPGSAIYDLLISPSALLQQQMRDRMRVIQRNQSLKNYTVMLPEELDRLASNYFVERRQGIKATGIQRVFFQAPQAVLIDLSTVFSTDDGRTYRPISAVSVSVAALTANFQTTTSEYYVDVPTISAASGERFLALAGEVTRFSGITGATRTTNLENYFGAQNSESNSELYVRIKKSLTNRDLVKKDAFKSALLEKFPSIKDVIVQGYQDEFMTRDVIQAVIATELLFQTSFCQKVNLPLNSSGEVQWEDEDGVTITAPLGGFVGAVYDLTGKDFTSLSVTLDGRTFQTVCVQPGNKVRFLGASDSDADNGDHLVTRVEEVPVAAGGADVKVLRLDRPLIETADVGSSIETTPYTVLGYNTTNSFHIGGKIDLYVDSSSDANQAVIVGALPPVNDNSLFVSEVPLTSTYLDSSGTNLFEKDVGFSDPVLSILKVEQLDPGDETIVLRELIPEVHYVLVRKESRDKFTLAESDVLVIRGEEEFLDATGTAIADPQALFVGQRIKITYVTNPDYPLVTSYIENDANRDITKDVVIKIPESVILDVKFEYTGSTSEEDVRQIVTEYIDNLGFGATITVNEIVSVLAFFGVTDIKMPMELTSRRDTGAGAFEFISSEDRIELDSIQLFTADIPLLITRIG